MAISGKIQPVLNRSWFRHLFWIPAGILLFLAWYFGMLIYSLLDIETDGRAMRFQSRPGTRKFSPHRKRKLKKRPSLSCNSNGVERKEKYLKTLWFRQNLSRNCPVSARQLHIHKYILSTHFYAWDHRNITFLAVKLIRLASSINNGWYPELVILTEVFSNCTYLAVVIPKSTVNRKLFYSNTSWKPYQTFIFTQFIEGMHNWI